MEVIFYTTDCPRCSVLEKKLNEKNINFIKNNNIEEMISVGIVSTPYLRIDNRLYDFSEAIKWINSQE